MVNRRFMWRATLGRTAFKRLTGRGRTVDAGGGEPEIPYVAFRFFCIEF